MCKTCKKCGAEKPHAEFSKHKKAKDGLQSRCKVCTRECHKKWREKNREYDIERQKKWREENKEHRREYAKKWNEENPEYNKKRYEENKDYYHKYNKRYREENKEQESKRIKKWREDNPHLCREYTQRRRAWKKAALPHLSENENLALKILSEEASMLGEGWHLDHIVPISKGGLHHPDNLQIVRASYNLSKKDKLWQTRKYV